MVQLDLIQSSFVLRHKTELKQRDLKKHDSLYLQFHHAPHDFLILIKQQ